MTTETTDILNLDDITKLVDAFYDKVRKDELLSPIFNERIEDCWPEHLKKMYAFWQTVLLDERTYNSSPFPPHAQLPIDHIHFQQWMQLFTTTVDGLFGGEKAREAKWRAAKMAALFEAKIEHARKQGFRNLL
jgi:hemoglobin